MSTRRTVGLQLYEGSTVTIPNQITDDVQVRSVELMVNGTTVLKDISYPYDLTTVLPKIADVGNQVTLQVRATDTGGNVSLSDPIVIDLLKDVTPPTVTSIDPADGSTQSLSKRTISIQFSEPLDPTTVVPANFVLHGPSGDVTPVSVDLRQNGTLVSIIYPPLTTGDYQFVMHAAAITDRVGNPFGASDTTTSFHIGAVARPATIRWVNTAGGNWSNPNNWVDVATNQHARAYGQRRRADRCARPSANHVQHGHGHGRQHRFQRQLPNHRRPVERDGYDAGEQHVPHQGHKSQRSGNFQRHHSEGDRRTGRDD